MKVAQLLGLWGPWWHQVCRDTDCLCRRSYGPIRVFFRASCSWRSEGLFGQSFSVALPIQALRGFPSLGSFSVVRCVRHIEGAPRLGSYSVVQCQALDGPALCCSAADAGAGREAMVLAPAPMCDSAVPPCFHGCLTFLHRHFPSRFPSSHPLDPSLHSQQQPSPWDWSTIPNPQLPASVPSRGLASLSGICMAAARTV